LPSQESLAEAARLGFGDALAVSAAHGDGMADVASALSPLYDAHEARAADMAPE
jgi:GTPase